MLLTSCFQAILKTSIDRGHVGCEKFSRWLRAICTILLSRGRPSDRIKALGYVEQAVDVMKSADHEVGYQLPFQNMVR